MCGDALSACIGPVPSALCCHLGDNEGQQIAAGFTTSSARCFCRQCGAESVAGTGRYMCSRVACLARLIDLACRDMIARSLLSFEQTSSAWRQIEAVRGVVADDRDFAARMKTISKDTGVFILYRSA